MKIDKIIIHKSRQAYDSKYELEEMGVYYDYKIKAYTNSTDISLDAMQSIKNLCDKLGLSYNMEEVEVKGTKDITKNLYAIHSLNNNDFFIRYRKNNETAYSIVINDRNNQKVAFIVDYQTFQTGKITFSQHESENILDSLFTNLTKQMEELEKSQELNIGSLVQILSILLDDYTEIHTLERKLMNFKFLILEQIKNKNQDGFLCNCVPGFHFDTEFRFQGTKIISSYTQNQVTATQEFNILKYLFKSSNRNLVGVSKQPTLYDMFHGKKIKVRTREGMSEMLISALKYENDKIKIQVYDGSENHWIDQLFNFEGLKKTVLNNEK